MAKYSYKIIHVDEDTHRRIRNEAVGRAMTSGAVVRELAAQLPKPRRSRVNTKEKR